MEKEIKNEKDNIEVPDIEKKTSMKVKWNQKKEEMKMFFSDMNIFKKK
jgi:hypothetical protein